MELRRTSLVASLVPLASVLVSALALMGCDTPGFKSKVSSPSDVAKSKGAAGEATTTSADVGQGGALVQTPAVFTPGLSVSDVIAAKCGIAPRAPGRTTKPSFDFDSSALGEPDRQMLAEVAKCLTEGALKGKSVLLVGRADPRGEPEYNMTLGESRANAVNRYMVDLGVGKDRMSPTSRGAMDATGTNEDGWAQDRRVDIELAP